MAWKFKDSDLSTYLGGVALLMALVLILNYCSEPGGTEFECPDQFMQTCVEPLPDCKIITLPDGSADCT